MGTRDIPIIRCGEIKGAPGGIEDGRGGAEDGSIADVVGGEGGNDVEVAVLEV